MLYACYDLIRLDVVMEVAWRHGLTDFTMVSSLPDGTRIQLTVLQPFMINFMSQQAMAIESLQKDYEERKAREASQKKDEDNTPILGGSKLMLTQGPGVGVGAPSPQPYGQANGFTPQATGFRAF